MSIRLTSFCICVRYELGIRPGSEFEVRVSTWYSLELRDLEIRDWSLKPLKRLRILGA